MAENFASKAEKEGGWDFREAERAVESDVSAVIFCCAGAKSSGLDCPRGPVGGTPIASFPRGPLPRGPEGALGIPIPTPVDGIWLVLPCLCTAAVPGLTSLRLTCTSPYEVSYSTSHLLASLLLVPAASSVSIHSWTFSSGTKSTHSGLRVGSSGGNMVLCRLFRTATAMEGEEKTAKAWVRRVSRWKVRIVAEVEAEGMSCVRWS